MGATSVGPTLPRREVVEGLVGNYYEVLVNKGDLGLWDVGIEGLEHMTYLFMVIWLNHQAMIDLLCSHSIVNGGNCMS